MSRLQVALANTLLPLLLCAAPLLAQVCSFTWNTNPACQPSFSCVDSLHLNGITLDVPAGVTRIAPGGLSICLADTAIKTSADIIYIVDMSRSMCACYSTPGDPYNKRAEAVMAGYAYQRDSVPGSRFGYLAFSDRIVTTSYYTGRYYVCGTSTRRYLSGNHSLAPVDLSLPAGRTSAETVIGYLDTDQRDSGISGTNYYYPLRQSLQWFRDPATSPNPNKAIVFITDGNPNANITEHRRIVDTLSQLGIPVYGVYLGSSVGSYLTEMTTETGGYTILVEPTATDTLADVVRNIVREINQFAFDTLTVSVPGATSQGIRAIKNAAAGTWEITLDSILPLHPGANSVHFYAQFAGSGTGGGRVIDFTFTINVGTGTANPSCYSCVTSSRLELRTTGGAHLDSLNASSTAYVVRFVYHGGDLTDAVDVTVRTNKGDVETVHMTSPTVAGDSVVFQQQVSFGIVDEGTPATPNNGVTEALPSDTVWATWHHPRDTLDRASAFAPVLAPPNRTALYSAAGAPTAPNLYAGPPTVITRQAGVAMPLYSKVFRNTTWLSGYETDPTKAGLFTWEVRDAGTGAIIVPAVGALSSATGPAVQFTGYQSGATVNVISTFTEGSNLFRDTVRVLVTAGSTLHLVVEASADSNASRHADNPIDQVQFLAGDTTRDVFGILRDQYGNFAGYATTASWIRRSAAVCTVFVSQASTGQATIRRRSAGAAQTQVVATQGSYVDSTLVITESITYTRIRLMVNQGGMRDIDTLRLRTDSSATLYAQGQRSDNGQWELVPVTWYVANAPTTTPVPGGVNNWTFTPSDTAHGRIFIKRVVSGTDTARDTTVSIFLLGRPAMLALFHQAGTPGGANTSYPMPPAVDTLIAGVAVDLYAKLFDNRNVWLTQYEDASAPITWSRVELGPNPPTGTTTPLTGNTTRFTPTRAYNTVEITATFVETGITLARAARFYVKADTTLMHLVIEGSSLRSVSPNADAPLANVTIASADTTGNAFAILRDRYGNFVRPATNATWVSLAPAIVLARAGVAVNGEGVFSRQADQGQTDVYAQSGSLRDTVRVILSSTTYDSLRIVDALTNDIVRDTIRTDQSRTYTVIARRTDNGEWDNMAVSWRSVGLTTTPLAPSGLVDQWAFQPTVHNQSGRVVVSLVSAETIYDSVFVVTTPGLPDHVVLFPATGAPYQGANQPLAGPAVVDTIVAGTTRQFVAKVFDHHDVWLSQYESAGAPVSWQTIPTLADTVTPKTGYLTRFTPYNARTQLFIEAVFSENGIVLRDTVQVYVKASVAHHLVIEATADPTVSPINDNPVYGVTLSSSDTITYVFATIRDQYGNFIMSSPSTQWGSLDTTVVQARGGVAVVGEGAIVRVGASGGSTRVYAYNTATPTLRDTIDVDISDVTYDSLRIVVFYQGYRDLDTLRVRTDQDTVLWAMGRRSDNRQWDDVRVPWTLSNGLTTQVAPPASDYQWTVQPTSLGTGVVTISRVNGAGVTIADQVVVVFSPGLPASLVLYPAVGQPGVGNNVPYPAPNITDTVTAGDTIPLFAKLFDDRLVWLSQYEMPSALIHWSLVELGGTAPTGTLVPRDGSASSFVPRNAFNRAYVIAQYTPTGFADTMWLYVRSDTATHLVLEASSVPNPIDDNPAGTVTIGTRDTVASVYAILRDQFGNFVDYGQNLDWVSGDTNVASASPGNLIIGQGRAVRRSAQTDTTFVYALSRSSPLLVDTVTVILASVSYDSLRIVNENGDTISSLTTTTDGGSVMLQVQGKRSDNGVWEAVPAQWYASAGLALGSVPAAQNYWEFTPSDTGRGYIRVSMGSAVKDSVTIVVGHGAPVRVTLYPAAGAPSPVNTPLPTTATVTAGDTLRLTAKVFDHHDVWLNAFETASDSIRWHMEEVNNLTFRDGLSDTIRYQTRFAPTQAQRTLRIITELRQGQTKYYDTIVVSVTPGAADHLVLEPDQNAGNYEADNPVDTITLTLIETYRRVYAIVRDRFGNFVDYSKRTTWGNTGADSVVSVADGISNVGEGQITKTYTGSDSLVFTTAYAISQDFPGLSDSVGVRVMQIFFDSLRITLAGVPVVLDSLVMFTDDDTTLRVQGKRSDNGQWVDWPARWETSFALPVAPQAPELYVTWRFSPTAPDTGWIRVTLDVDSVSHPDTVPVIFRLSPPSVVLFDIITPPDSLVAGNTIRALVRIRNRDGQVPGTYCDSSLYWNPLTRADGSRPRDTALVDGAASSLGTTSGSATSSSECFEGGVDTVRFVLYYAPSDPDSLTQLFVRIGSTTGSTEPFRLLPGPLARMQLEDQNGLVPDSIVMRPYTNQLLAAAGYDRYGNRRGKEMSRWTQNGQIPPLPSSMGRQIFYMVNLPDDNGEGWITAVVMDTASGHFADSVHIRITGVLPVLLTAAVHDTSGNGMLDLLTLHFSKNLRLGGSFVPLADAQLVRGSYTFEIDSAWRYGSDSTEMLLGIVERLNLPGQELSRNKADYQTSWQPVLTVDFHDSATAIVSDTCIDSAGPVLVAVNKRMRLAFDRRADRVTVVFSEPILGHGGQLNPNIPPDSLFVVWWKTDTGFVQLPYRLLDSIPSLLAVRGADTVEFQMLNGRDLTTMHYLNINAATGIVSDQAPVPHNYASANNQQVKVRVDTRPPAQAIVFPNPSHPCATRVPPGDFHVAHNANARNYNLVTEGGTVISFTVTQPLPGTVVHASMVIYDVAGNIVQSGENANVARIPGTESASAVTIDIYWNGYNRSRMPVSPGVYRFIISLHYKNESTLDTKVFGNIGIVAR